MIIPYNEAYRINKDIDIEELEAMEIAIRNKTNNKFQNTRIRYKDITFIDDKTLGVDSKVIGLRVDDTIEINYSGYNDGLYVIRGVTDDTISFDSNSFTELDLDGAMITKIEYPADVKQGVRNMIEYDMKDKRGIKSETVARMSVTYADSGEGYPEGVVSFLNDYQKMRW